MKSVNFSPSGAVRHKYHQISSYSLAGASALAILIPSGNMFLLPVDFFLGLAIPYHGYVGMKNVVLDYVPRPLQRFSVLALAIASGATALGLTKLNLFGPGITSTVKLLWSNSSSKSNSHE